MSKFINRVDLLIYQSLPGSEREAEEDWPDPPGEHLYRVPDASEDDWSDGVPSPRADAGVLVPGGQKLCHVSKCIL